MVEGAVPSQWRTAVITPIPKVPKPTQSGGLQADLYNDGPFAVSRKVHRAYVHLPSVTIAISRALLWRPVRLPADRFNNCRGHSSASHCTQDVVYRPVRPRLLVWLYKGVRHRQACNFDEQGGAAEYPRQHLQLDKGVLWTALSLYQICRECSTVAAVKASVIQGSGLGPDSFIVTAADLHPTTPGNRIFKFQNKVKRAYLHSRKKCPAPATTAVPEHWTCRLRQGPRHYTQWSTECDWSCKQLADVVQQFAVRDESPPWSRHLDWVAPRRVSRHHPHCLPARSGLCSSSDRAKLDTFLNRCKRFGFCDNSIPTISDILVMPMTHYLKRFWKIVIMFCIHIYQKHYHLRQRPHNKALNLKQLT